MAQRSLLMDRLRDIPFAKMTGSGNDFVFFDGRQVDRALVTAPEVITAICDRHNGIGADGVVVLEPLHGASLNATGTPADAAADSSADLQARIHYFNSDGTPADLCGNATLCATVMSVELGLAQAIGLGLDTPAGRIASRITDGLPEIQLQPVTRIEANSSIELEAGEQRAGFAVAGIPHLVILCEDADAIDVARRGPPLRWHSAGGPSGANVNWVSPRTDGTWRYRTFERGVEGETLACGTGAVATAALLCTWRLANEPVTIRTSSGRDLTVRLRPDGDHWIPTLRGEGRIVFRGQIGDLRP